MGNKHFVGLIGYGNEGNQKAKHAKLGILGYFSSQLFQLQMSWCLNIQLLIILTSKVDLENLILVANHRVFTDVHGAPKKVNRLTCMYYC